MPPQEIIENNAIKREFVDQLDKIYFEIDKKKLLDVGIKQLDYDLLKSKKYN
jgi:hypothetical protein